MKKDFLKTAVVLLVSLVLAMCLSACAGTQDWVFTDLPGSYEIWRINSQTISLVRRNSEHGGEVVVDSYVCEIAWTDAYLFAQKKDTKETSDSEMCFYIVQVEGNQVTGPLSEEEFEAQLEQLEMVHDDLDWIGALDLTPRTY